MLTKKNKKRTPKNRGSIKQSVFSLTKNKGLIKIHVPYLNCIS